MELYTDIIYNFCSERSAYTKTYSYMGASLNPIGLEDPKLVKYCILLKMSDTIEFLLKQELLVQICCIFGLYFLAIWVIFEIFSPLGCLKNDQKL